MLLGPSCSVMFFWKTESDVMLYEVLWRYLYLLHEKIKVKRVICVIKNTECFTVCTKM